MTDWNLVRAGVPDRVGMQMAGYKTRSVFERYNIVSDTHMEEYTWGAGWIDHKYSIRG